MLAEILPPLTITLQDTFGNPSSCEQLQGTQLNAKVKLALDKQNDETGDVEMVD